jgi:E3 ubiquitin-protein ligase UBR4
VPALSPLAAELAVLDEEGDDEPEGLCCMVCREGYALQPGSLLGAYAFTRAVPADEFPGCAPPPGFGGGAAASSSAWGGAGAAASAAAGAMLTTVSHFNLIHAACHASARAADAALRQPKREWEGASRRNGDVLCNCLVPLRGGAVTDTAYVAAVAALWEAQTAAPMSGAGAAAAGARRMCAALRAADSTGARLSLLASDLAALLRRFAWRLSFSDEARGGGRGSNARLALGLLQLGRYYAEAAHAGERRQQADLLAAAEAAGRAALGGDRDGGGEGAAGGDRAAALAAHAPHALALSLVLSSPEEWTRARGPMLALAARHGLWLSLRDGAGVPPGASPDAAGVAAVEAIAAGLTNDELFAAAAPGLRLFGLADALHSWAKPARGAGGWGRAMAQRLADLRACEEAGEQLLEALDEMDEAGDAQEALDVMGALGLALGAPLGGGAAACPSAAAWLRRVAAGGGGGAAPAAEVPAGGA